MIAGSKKLPSNNPGAARGQYVSKKEADKKSSEQVKRSGPSTRPKKKK